ncbi:MAG: 50S ribosomal protein L11 methyltransferase [Desulfobacterales bacterium]|nr:50S ribosomal protein L11 methyltransferase [Desulfobacterales bacterium]
MKKTYEKKIILEILENSESKLTPLNLIKKIVRKTRIASTSAKKTIKELTSQNELAYTYFFGSTYIELSFNKPVKITERFVLTPFGIKGTTNRKDINIIIDPGISFGSGRHPTTRLSLKALDHVITLSEMNQLKPIFSNNTLTGLDIGTGSGVLAIAACKTCVSNCLALDIDPNSLVEAKKNVILNDFENKIIVSDTDIDTLKGEFSLILANLRYPTLKNLAKKITLLSKKNTVLIMSGIRTYEKDDLITLYTNCGFNLLFEKDEKKWSCIAMQIENFKEEI